MAEMPDVGDGGMEAAKHIAMCIPMQQSWMICTSTPEPKVQLKKKKPRSHHKEKKSAKYKIKRLAKTL